MNTLKRWKSNTSTKTAATASSINSDNDDAPPSIPEESEAGPSSAPSGIEPSPSAGSADKFRLSLLQPSRTVTPGTTIQGHIDIVSLKDCKSLHVILTGKCGCMIMGKMRYQAAIGVNALGGGGYGGAAPITFRESHCFLNVTQLIWDAEDPDGAIVARSPTEKPSPSIAPASYGKRRFEFAIDVPKMKQCTCSAVTYALPPSVDLRHFDPSAGAIDTSTIEVKYSISAILDRKGFLKRKQKVKIPLQVVDDAPPGYAMQQEIHCAQRGPFKYASQDSTDVPELECMLSFVPPTNRGGSIDYTVIYRIADSNAPPFPEDNGSLDDIPMSPPPFQGGAAPDLPPLYQASSAPLLSTVNPRVELVLNRASRTRPLQRTREGQEFHWAPMAIAQGKTNTAHEDNEGVAERNARLGHGEVKGTLQVPKDEVTMFTCGAEISHFIQARVYSQALKRPITVRCKVYLPSGR